MPPSSLTSWIDKKFYKNYKDNWDNDEFRRLVLKYLDKNSTYLDLGAGRGALPHMNFKGLCKEAFGIDPEEAVFENPYLDKAFVGFGNSMPFFEDNKFDLIASNNVLEHLENPEAFFKEVNRVLRPGGILITKTPNKNYYIMLLSTLMPTSFHKLYNKLRGRPTIDTFPTFYRINTATAVKRMAVKKNFEIVELFLLEGRPEYLRITPLTYAFGLVYERIINRLNIQSLKIVMYSVLRKKK